MKKLKVHISRGGAGEALSHAVLKELQSGKVFVVSHRKYMNGYLKWDSEYLQAANFMSMGLASPIDIVEYSAFSYGFQDKKWLDELGADRIIEIDFDNADEVMFLLNSYDTAKHALKTAHYEYKIL